MPSIEVKELDKQWIIEAQEQAREDGAPDGWPKRYRGQGPFSVGGIAYYDCFTEIAKLEEWQSFRRTVLAILHEHDEREAANDLNSANPVGSAAL